MKTLHWSESETHALAPYAMKAVESQGRQYPEMEHPFRSPFQRDRDRIIHSTAFRRLEYKTQVFVVHEGDYYRTRLTHTVEVAQIARTIARALGLNEDLTETIGLAHDLGHTPFGHSGEEALRELMKDFGGYEHNRQGLRVVTKLEKRYPEFDGLNLTFEVREGIIKHVSEYDQPEVQEYDPRLAPTLEAQVVNLADEIAYTSHDVDDGLKAGLISAEDLDRVRLWRDLYGKVSGRGLEPELARYAAVRDLINLLVTDLLEQTGRNISGRRIRSVEAVRRQAQPLVEFSPATARKHQELKKFLYENMYRHHRVIRMSEKAKRIIGDLFKVYTKQPKQLPPQVAGRISSAEPAARVVCDYIAGMTDNFALEEYQKLFDPFTRV